MIGPDRVLITGSSGCLGHSLACRLAGEGRTVVGLDIVRSGRPASYQEVIGDVGDPHLLHRLFARHAFDAVIHCGGISGQMVAPEDPYRNCQVNVLGTIHLLEVSRAHQVERFVFCSSQAAYGASAAAVITEAAPMTPVTVYGGTKAACDMLVTAYRMQYGLKATSLRIGRVYGPGRRTDSVITTMVEAALAGQPLRLPASGGRALQYVFEADVVSALYLAAMKSDLPQPAYNVSGPGRHTDEEIAAALCALVPEAEITFDWSAPARDGTALPPLDCSAAHRDFGYEPAYDLVLGLTEFLSERRRQRSNRAIERSK